MCNTYVKLFSLYRKKNPPWYCYCYFVGCLVALNLSEIEANYLGRRPFPFIYALRLAATINNTSHLFTTSHVPIYFPSNVDVLSNKDVSKGLLRPADCLLKHGKVKQNLVVLKFGHRPLQLEINTFHVQKRPCHICNSMGAVEGL